MQKSKIKNQNYKSKFKTFNFLLLLLTFEFLLFTFLTTKFAYGQNLSLGIYPPLLEVMIKPGKSITQVYKLINEGETDLVMTSKIVPFEPADELGNVKLETGNSKLEIINNWFSFQNADIKLGGNFVLKAGQAQQIVLKISIPQDAQEEDYYLTLLFETNPEEFFMGNQSAVQSRAKIGSNILLTISETGEPPRKAKIEEFSLANPQFRIANFQLIDSFTNPQFLLRIKNAGRSLFKPMGTITVTGWLGQKYPLNLLPENILTKSTRQIGCENESEEKICHLPSKFLLGFYQAKVEFGLDKVSNDYTATFNFIALPFKLLLIILGLIILIIITKLVQNRLKLSLDKRVKSLSN